MVSSISGSSGSDYIQQLMTQMLKNMSAADTDGTKGLSKAEISSISAGEDKGGENFLKELSSNFDKIDTDGNGQLTGEEIKSARPPRGQMGPPPGLMDALTSADTDGTTGLSTDELSSIDSKGNKGQSSFIQNLTENFDKLDANKDGQLSSDEIAASKPSGPPPEKTSDSSSTESSQVNDLVQSLLKNFDKLDTNEDGKLSVEELAAGLDAKNSKRATDTEGVNANANSQSSGDKGKSSDESNALQNIADYFIKQLVSAYKENAGTISSALNLAV